MANVEQLKKLVKNAKPSSMSLPPNERKPEEEVERAAQELKKLIERHPKTTFLNMLEYGIDGLDFFTLEQLKALDSMAIDSFREVLSNEAHQWYSNGKIIYLLAQLDNSESSLALIIQHLSVPIKERLIYVYYPKVASGLRLFDANDVVAKIEPILTKLSWTNRYLVALVLHNVAMTNRNHQKLRELLFFLMDMAQDADLDSPDGKIIKKISDATERTLTEYLGM